MLRIFFLTVCLVAAPLVRAHPHVFVDVSLRFQSDAQGRLTGVEVTWAYDQLFSLLLLSERGIDLDADGDLAAADRALLEGFDLTDWPDWFQGATFVYRGDTPLDLGTPESLDLALRDGRVVTRHLRRFETSMPGGLTVLPYDPSYYAALRLVGADGLPENCAARIVQSDSDAADARVAGLGGGEALFEEVKVGIYYADRLNIECD